MFDHFFYCTTVTVEIFRGHTAYEVVQTLQLQGCDLDEADIHTRRYVHESERTVYERNSDSSRCTSAFF